MRLRRRIIYRHPVATEDCFTFPVALDVEPISIERTPLMSRLLDILQDEMALEELLDSLQSEFSEVDIGEGVRTLLASGVIEDVTDAYFELTSVEKVRYQGNLGYFELLRPLLPAASSQRLLMSGRVCILGAGGIGANVAFQLAAAGVQHLTVVDRDSVELSNLNRQLPYAMDDVGKPKVEALAHRIRSLDPNIEVNTIRQTINGTSIIRKWIRGHDIVVMAFDEPIRYAAEWTNEACVLESVPYIAAGFVPPNRGVYYAFVPSLSGCLNCRNLEAGIVTGSDPRLQNGAPVGRVNITMVDHVSVLSGIVTSEVIRFVSRCGANSCAGRLQQLDFQTMQISTLEQWHRMPRCELCNRTGNCPPGTIGWDSRVQLHPAKVTPYPDDSYEWTIDGVGPLTLDQHGWRTLELVQKGLQLSEIRALIRSASGEDLDVLEFIETLLVFGAISEVDGVAPA